ncbi:MAG TPA: hypothetical protein VE971_06535 [Candidatus Eisenbacteria bacterium]|nr:hypothetical protein [Candidatus Eisenbacteria bacterium]
MGPIDEATFHIPEDVMRALKMKAVQENKRFSKVAEDALGQYLGFPKETRDIEESTTGKKKRGGTKP